MVTLKSSTIRARFMEYSHYVLDGGYRITEKNKEALEAIFETFERKPYGLIIYGNPGVGKTILFDMLNATIPPKHSRKFVKVNALDVVLDFNIAGHEIFRRNKNQTVLYDDLGTEHAGKFFGDKVEVFEKLIQFRYDLFRSSGIRTYFTTNLSLDEIKQRYGARCFSRLREMCEHVIIDDTDKRLLRNFRGLQTVYYEKLRTPEEIEFDRKYQEMKEKAKLEKPKPFVKEGIGTRIRKSLNMDKYQPKKEQENK